MLPHVKLPQKIYRSVDCIFSRIEESAEEQNAVSSESSIQVAEEEATQIETVQEETTAPCEAGAEDTGNDQAKAAQIEPATEEHAPECESGTEDIQRYSYTDQSYGRRAPSRVSLAQNMLEVWTLAPQSEVHMLAHESRTQKMLEQEQRTLEDVWNGL